MINKWIYKIDGHGFIIESYVGTFDDRGNLISHEGNYITVDLPQPLLFYKPKWTGTEWVEGESQSEREERKSQQLLESLNPSEEELSKAERELETIELLLEMGLI